MEPAPTQPKHCPEGPEPVSDARRGLDRWCPTRSFTFQGMDRHTQRFMPVDQEQEIIASFGEARLVRHSNGRLEILGGTQGDRQLAEEWVARFLRPAEGRFAWRSG